MSRWIVFDRKSHAVVATAGVADPELQENGDALALALATDRNTVVLMPGRSSDRVLVATVRHIPKPPAEARRAPVYEAAGILGLRDAEVYEDEPAPPKKWWQKILD